MNKCVPDNTACSSFRTFTRCKWSPVMKFSKEPVFVALDSVLFSWICHTSTIPMDPTICCIDFMTSFYEAYMRELGTCSPQLVNARVQYARSIHELTMTPFLDGNSSLEGPRMPTDTPTVIPQVDGTDDTEATAEAPEAPADDAEGLTEVTDAEVEDVENRLIELISPVVCADVPEDPSAMRTELLVKWSIDAVAFYLRGLAKMVIAGLLDAVPEPGTFPQSRNMPGHFFLRHFVDYVWSQHSELLGSLGFSDPSFRQEIYRRHREYCHKKGVLFRKFRSDLVDTLRRHNVLPSVLDDSASALTDITRTQRGRKPKSEVLSIRGDAWSFHGNVFCFSNACWSPVFDSPDGSCCSHLSLVSRAGCVVSFVFRERKSEDETGSNSSIMGGSGNSKDWNRVARSVDFASFQFIHDVVGSQATCSFMEHLSHDRLLCVWRDGKSAILSLSSNSVSHETRSSLTLLQMLSVPEHVDCACAIQSSSTVVATVSMHSVTISHLDVTHCSLSKARTWRWIDASAFICFSEISFVDDGRIAVLCSDGSVLIMSTSGVSLPCPKGCEPAVLQIQETEGRVNAYRIGSPAATSPFVAGTPAMAVSPSRQLIIARPAFSENPSVLDVYAL
eukprot:ANDGO_06970.mRNA.2 hypothetical protein